jgi:hypothetical protein
MKKYTQILKELSPSNELIKIKGDVQDKLILLGFKVSVTDTPQLVFFTDKPINKKSKGPIKSGPVTQYITSFGKVGALKFLKK